MSGRDIWEAEVGCRPEMEQLLRRLSSTWAELGIAPDHLRLRATTVWQHVVALLKDIVEEESEYLERVKTRVKEYEEKIPLLRSALSLPTVTAKVKDKTPLQLEEQLRLEMDELVCLKHSRQKAYSELREEEQELRKVLCAVEYPPLNARDIPSESDMESLLKHISQLKEEKETRLKTFATRRTELIDIYKLTGMEAESSFEKEIISGNTPQLLSEEHLKALDQLVSRVREKQTELEKQKRHLLERLSALWKRLSIDENFQSEFMSKHTDCRAPTIKAVEREVERCEAIKRQNLQQFVETLRAELRQLWLACHVGEGQRLHFARLLEADASDAVLEAHEAEVARWQAYRKRVAPILDLVGRREGLWRQMRQLEVRAADPSRLHNRGGTLLKEEQKRTALQRKLPALEAEVFQLIEALDEPFLFDGQDYRIVVKNQWEKRTEMKESERAERQMKHQLQLEHEATMGTPLMPRSMRMLTPKTAPSKILVRPVTPNTLQRRPPQPSTVGRPPTQPRDGTRRLQPKGTLVQQRTPVKEIRRVLRDRNTTSRNATTYSDFAREMNSSSRKACRSSVRGNKSKRKSGTKPPKPIVSKVLTPARGKLGIPFLI